MSTAKPTTTGAAEKYQVLPDLPPEQYEALKADIAERGVMVAVELDEHGQILDGHHCARVCRELGINDYPVVVRSGLSEEDKRVFARKAAITVVETPGYDPLAGKTEGEKCEWYAFLLFLIRRGADPEGAEDHCSTAP